MSIKNTLVGIIVVGGFLLMTSTPEKKAINNSKKYIFKNLDIKNLKEFSIKSNEQSVTLNKDNDTWKVSSLDNFKADEEIVNAFLMKALALKTGVRVSSGKKYFSQFGLDKGLLLEFKSNDNKVMSSAIFGNNRMAKSGMFGSAPNGQYIRFTDQEVIYLLKDAVSLKSSSEDWISKKLPSIKQKDIKTMTVKSEGLKSVSITRFSTQDNLVINDISDKEEVKSQDLNQFTKVLENFTFASVAKLNSEKVSKSQTTVDQLEVHTFDGLIYQFKIGKKIDKDPHHWTTLTLSHLNGDTKIQNKVTQLNQQWKNWAFALPAYSAKSLLKKRSDLIQKKEDKTVKKIEEKSIEYGAKHILLAYKGASRSKQSRSKKEALKLSKEVLSLLEKGEKFEDLAKKYSDGPSKSKGGDLGTFGPKMMAPAFEMATSLLKVGESTKEAIETDFGYHLILRTK
ncbi:MAG: hypothetical protein COB02_07130 [Candidatus Cloacimonadota bacterium]|nr:MAG: hypothetical protein COB02_07130 [Candidatus Cloacimonadota bacterium]